MASTRKRHSRNELSPASAGPEAEPTAEVDTAELGLYSVGEVRLLVLDDDPSVCKLIRSALAPHKFVIDVVSEPARMEAQLRAKSYHLVILDYVIPGLESDQLLGWVRELQPDASVLVITAFPSIDSALSCLRARTYDYLTKPFQVDELRRLVTRCLESKGLLRLSEEALREALGMAIRERRKALGLTLAQMAQRTGLSLGYLSQIELGKNSASVETLYRISLGLALKMADLFQSVQKTL
ncbi:MAG TPA: response regulator [Gemmataceae bacterium]|nr:response regulator [Gemmataceae bacterium]